MCFKIIKVFELIKSTPILIKTAVELKNFHEILKQTVKKKRNLMQISVLLL
jgi:hypothetical protein